ncbi:MAG: RNA methyltransferase [Clostridia bacterium]|nr:RNA methyltransferase [Clostridia bacterium]
MNKTYISSRTNETIVSFSKLKDKKEREIKGLYLCEGFKLCSEAVGITDIKYVLLRENKADSEKYIKLCEKSGADVIVLSEGAFDKITTDKASDGIIFVIKKEDSGEIKADDIKNEKICALDSVRDPGNVGTILRSAAAFGFDRVILWDCADLYNPKTVRASMGALFKIKTSVVSDPLGFIKQLQSSGRRVIATALSDNSMTLGKSKLMRSDCPVLGNEGHGVSPEIIDVCDATMIIPMSDKTESLNAATAAAVILWEYGREEL